ncbi:carboxypeptidase regulatory-like domain-containing protein [bacterium]|nr:carboxypeptidase regulatory-like domain-containing protein [bacterium]
MKRIILASFLALLSASQGLAQTPVRIFYEDRSEVEPLFSNPDVMVDNVKPDTVIAYVFDKGMRYLDEKGYYYEPFVVPCYRGQKLSTSTLYYPEYSEIRDTLHSFAESYPELCRLDSIGPTQEGRWMYIMRITDNPDIQEDEPEFRYSSTMHGDEPVSVPFCIEFIKMLLTGYGTDPDITEFVNEIDLWVMPLYNPDGYEHTPSWQRTLSNGIDPNRNFPVPDGSMGEDGTYTVYQETQAFMDFCNERYFVASANFHTGALIVNRLWDHTSTIPDEEPLLFHMAIHYSRYNSPMYTNPNPDSAFGTTNGYRWYEVDGSLQDWVYWQRSDIDFTIELSNTKAPPVSSLDGLWEDNREAMFQFALCSLWGIRGIVTDSITGEPLPATVSVEGLDRDVHCDPAVGDYHRILLNGFYNLTFSCPGYRTKTVTGVYADTTEATRLDVQLAPLGTSRIHGIALLPDATEHSGIRVQATSGDFTRTDTTDSDGNYELLSLIPGDYTITASKEGYGDTAVSVTVGDYDDLVINFTLYQIDTVYLVNTDFEMSAVLTETSGTEWEWGIPTSGPDTAHSGVNCWATNLSGNYSDGAEAMLETDEYELPANATDAKLTFWHWYEFEQGGWPSYRRYDGGNVKIQVDGGEWTVITPEGGYDGTITSSNPYIGGEEGFNGETNGNHWHTEEFDLSAYLGHTVKVRFHFGSDAGVNYAGWYIDDLKLYYIVESLNIIEERTQPHRLHLSCYPNPFNESINIRFCLPEEENITLSAYNIKGETVRTIFSGKAEPGEHILSWNACDLPSGMYFVRINGKRYSASKKIILLR